MFFLAALFYVCDFKNSPFMHDFNQNMCAVN